MAQSVYERIKASSQLPSPKGVALEVIRLAEAEDTTVEQIARVVERDPAIASKLLRLVNSPASGVSRRVGSVQLAVGLVGLRTLRTMALGASLVSEYGKGACAGFPYERFWSESIVRAVAAPRFGRSQRRFAPDELFTFGLLCRVGRLALACAFTKEYSEVLLGGAASNAKRLRSAEKEAFGIDHAELAAEMMRDWRLPTAFCETVREESDFASRNECDPPPGIEDLREVFRHTDLIANLLHESNPSSDSAPQLAAIQQYVGVDFPGTVDMLSQITTDWRQTCETFSLKPSVVPQFTA